jgi:hypothetical protein
MCLHSTIKPFAFEECFIGQFRQQSVNDSITHPLEQHHMVSYENKQMLCLKSKRCGKQTMSEKEKEKEKEKER